MHLSLTSLSCVLCASLLLAGCGGVPTVSHKDRVPITKAQIVGQWEAIQPDDSSGDAAVASPSLVQFNADGSGMLINGRIWTDPRNSPFSAYYFPIRWEQTAPDTLKLSAGPPQTIAGVFSFGWLTGPPSSARAYSTAQGLVIDGLFANGAYFSKLPVPVSNPKEVLIARTRALTDEAARNYRVRDMEQVRSRNRAQNQALLGALSSFPQSTSMGGAGSYASTSSNYAAQQAVATVTQEVMVAALTDSPEEAQAARQSFQTGYAIGSGNTQAMAQNLAGGAGQGNAAQAGGSNAAQSAAAAQMAEAISSGKDFVTTVAVPDARQYGYSDGYAYNIQAVLPNPGYHNAGGSKTAGEFCIFYGLPLEQARSLLATGFALSADRSVDGPGNPQQIVSWERVSVRNGGSVKMGVQWQTGTMPAAPRFANRYINRKP